MAAKKLSQHAVAGALNIQQAYISLWLNNKHTPSAHLISVAPSEISLACSRRHGGVADACDRKLVQQARATPQQQKRWWQQSEASRVSFFVCSTSCSFARKRHIDNGVVAFQLHCIYSICSVCAFRVAAAFKQLQCASARIDCERS